MKPWIAVPATLALVYRAWSRKSLTPLGIVVATLTAVAHAVHPWSVFFALLAVFFLAGSTVTKVKHDVKAKLTHTSSGAPGGEGARTHVQVLANSAVASILILAHTWTLKKNGVLNQENRGTDLCWSKGGTGRASDVLVAGIIANYAAVAADTFSSELGILSSSAPRLVTAPWRTVAPGTNGGITLTGLLAGLLGSFLLSATATVLLPFCTFPQPAFLSSYFSTDNKSTWSVNERLVFLASMTILGLGGSLLDSLLGALLQASVVDVRTGKVVEGEGGAKVLVHRSRATHLKQRQKIAAKLGQSSGDVQAPSLAGDDGVRSRKAGAASREGEKQVQQGRSESRRIETGWDVLSNNGVNVVMAGSMSLVAVLGTAWAWDVSVMSVVKDIFS